MLGSHRFREPPRTCKRRQIGLIEDRLSVPPAAYLVGKDFGPRLVAAMDQNFGAGGGEFGGDIAADAIGRTRDQHRLAVHVHRGALPNPSVNFGRSGKRLFQLFKGK